ncbi:hypothetical protein N3K66_000819 [Trichothecium roseum]|uniref:Uncharacterized protein n=1 Tax=Trichothecium roseum TaxID=47278 RepID=A0ACC0VEN2_9HYPO|nr:hypothetical protein N3K66_000819 [Trichothecium roseum]
MTRQPSWKDIPRGKQTKQRHLMRLSVFCMKCESLGHASTTTQSCLWIAQNFSQRPGKAYERNVFKQGIHRGFNDLIQAIIPLDFTSPGEERALEIMINNRHLGGVVHDAIQTWINTNEVLGLIDHAFTYHQVDFLVVPAWSWLSVYSAIAGAPTAIIPLGTYTSGLTFGMAIIGREGTYNADARLLELIKLYENDFAQRDAPPSMRYRLDNLYARSRVSLDALERYSRAFETMTR